MRLTAQQICPLPRARRPRTTALAAFSRSASARMIMASLPPSSRWTFLRCLGGELGDADPDGRAAGDRDQLDAGRLRQVIPDQSTGAGDDLMGAGGQPGLFHQFGDLEQRQGAGAGGLRDHGVAGGQRRRRLVPPQLHRVVERNDGGHDAQRLPNGHGEVPLLPADGVDRHDAPEDPLRLLRRSRGRCWPSPPPRPASAGSACRSPRASSCPSSGTRASIASETRISMS